MRVFYPGERVILRHKSDEKALSELDEKLRSLKQKVPLVESEENKPNLEAINNELVALVKEYASKLSQSVQLESGKYLFEIEVSYRKTDVILSSVKKARSGLEFQIETSDKEQIQNNVAWWLYNRGSNQVFNKTDQIIFPEYQPENVREI